MSTKAVGGIDNQGQRLKGVATATADDDAVPLAQVRTIAASAGGGGGGGGLTQAQVDQRARLAVIRYGVK